MNKVLKKIQMLVFIVSELWARDVLPTHSPSFDVPLKIVVFQFGDINISFSCIMPSYYYSFPLPTFCFHMKETGMRKLKTFQDPPNWDLLY